MCVWYNMTKRQRLMMLILGRHLMKEEEVELEPLHHLIATSNCGSNSPR